MENAKSISFTDKQLLEFLLKQSKKESLKSSLLLSIDEAIIILRINREAILTFIRLGYFKAVKTGKGIKIYRPSFEALAEKLFDKDLTENFGQEISDFYEPIKDKINV